MEKEESRYSRVEEAGRNWVSENETGNISSSEETDVIARILDTEDGELIDSYREDFEYAKMQKELDMY